MIHKSHQLFLWVQEKVTSVPWVRFLVRFFDKRLDVLLGLIATVWVGYNTQGINIQSRIYVISSFLIIYIATTIIKYTIREPRPFITYKHLYNSPNHFGKNDSFPSNHTVYFFGLATVASLLMGSIIWPLYILALFIGITRVVGGVHYPHDVAAGVLFGTIGVWIILRMMYVFV